MLEGYAHAAGRAAGGGVAQRDASAQFSSVVLGKARESWRRAVRALAEKEAVRAGPSFLATNGGL